MNDPLFDDDAIDQGIEAIEEDLAGYDPEEDEEFCRGCGCSQSNPCPGGCVWATPELCSRCVR
ncbi:MAG TPA: hypothetical protein VGH22_15455 [Candidatus Binatia bacterium]|jgi:hypothetical protein